jgi:SAM-dependent methyltransferase
MYDHIKALFPRRYRYLARAVWCNTLAFLFVGDNVECPVCGKASRRWISLGLDEGMCPRCMSENRHRLIGLYIRNELDIDTRPLTVLHFAAEYCFLRWFRKSRNITYIVADLDPPKGGVKIDVGAIPLETESVDVLICSHVLEHVQEDIKAMRELGRVLRRGGTALIMCPVDYDRETTYEDPSIVSFEGRREAFHQGDHVRIYGADFDERLRSAGFHVEAIRYGQTVQENASRYGVDTEEIIYVCTVGAGAS